MASKSRTPGGGPSAPPDGFHPRRVLVVDDNPFAARGLARIVGLWGHETRVALDGEEAIASAREFRPEVVLLDIGLPGISGHAVARTLREAPWFGPASIFSMSGFGLEDLGGNGMNDAFDHHLLKPIDLDALKLLLSAPFAGGEGDGPDRDRPGQRST